MRRVIVNGLLWALLCPNWFHRLTCPSFDEVANWSYFHSNNHFFFGKLVHMRPQPQIISHFGARNFELLEQWKIYSVLIYALRAFGHTISLSFPALFYILFIIYWRWTWFEWKLDEAHCDAQSAHERCFSSPRCRFLLPFRREFMAIRAHMYAMANCFDSPNLFTIFLPPLSASLLLCTWANTRIHINVGMTEIGANI